MTNKFHTEMPDAALRSLWAARPVEPFHMPLQEVQARADAFRKKIFWRNTREYIAAGFIFILSACRAVTVADPFIRWGSVAMCMSAVFITYLRYRHGRAEVQRPFESCHLFHLRQLKHHEQWTRVFWPLVLVSVLPGTVLIIGSGLVRTSPQKRGIVLAIIAVTLVFMFVRWLGRLRQLEAEIRDFER